MNCTVLTRNSKQIHTGRAGKVGRLLALTVRYGKELLMAEFRINVPNRTKRLSLLRRKQLSAATVFPLCFSMFIRSTISRCRYPYFHVAYRKRPFNFGKPKLYEGVPGNLVAFACKLSLEKGYEGFVAFTSKTKLIQHYEETLGAVHVGGHRMVIYEKAAMKLVNQYFKSK